MEITVKSQKRRREAPTYPAAPHRARRGGAARGNSKQPPGGVCSSRAAPAWATLYNMPASCVPGVTLSPPCDHAPHCWFLEQQPHLHARVALGGSGGGGAGRGPEASQVFSAFHPAGWCPVPHPARVLVPLGRWDQCLAGHQAQLKVLNRRQPSMSCCALVIFIEDDVMVVES